MTVTPSGVEAKLYQKVSKLLALAGNNPSEHEATLAANRAQALMDKHKLDWAVLSALEAGKRPEQAKLQDVTEGSLYKFNGRRITYWVQKLASGVAEANGLYFWLGWYAGNRALKAAGPADTLAAAEQLTYWLVAEVKRLWEREKYQHRGKGRSFANSWRMGCAMRIAERLREQASNAEAKQREEQQRIQAERELAYEAAIEAGDRQAIAELDASEPRYGLAVFEAAHEILRKQKRANRDWAEEQYSFTRRSYGGSTRGGGFNAGTKAGNKARINSGRGIR